jgi:hypothetical protein
LFFGYLGANIGIKGRRPSLTTDGPRETWIRNRVGDGFGFYSLGPFLALG